MFKVKKLGDSQKFRGSKFTQFGEYRDGVSSPISLPDIYNMYQAGRRDISANNVRHPRFATGSRLLGVDSVRETARGFNPRFQYDLGDKSGDTNEAGVRAGGQLFRR